MEDEDIQWVRNHNNDDGRTDQEIAVVIVNLLLDAQIPMPSYQITFTDTEIETGGVTVKIGYTNAKKS